RVMMWRTSLLMSWPPIGWSLRFSSAAAGVEEHAHCVYPPSDDTGPLWTRRGLRATVKVRRVRVTADVLRQVRAWVSDMRRLACAWKGETSRRHGGTQLASTGPRAKPGCAWAARSPTATARAFSSAWCFPPGMMWLPPLLLMSWPPIGWSLRFSSAAAGIEEHRHRLDPSSDARHRHTLDGARPRCRRQVRRVRVTADVLRQVRAWASDPAPIMPFLEIAKRRSRMEARNPLQRSGVTSPAARGLRGA